MDEELIIEELGKEERLLLLRANDYNSDEEGYVLTPSGERIESKENPNEFMKAEFVALNPGSLKIIEGSPTAISEFLRERKSVKKEDGRK